MAAKITMGADGILQVPENPIIPFIEGDGTGIDIWPAARHVLDAAAAKYGHTVEWKEVLAGEKAYNETGDWLPQETVDTFTDYLIGIKGPLTTPIGGGFRSLNVALRQILDLYVCLRPVRWFQGVPSPVKHPELVDMVIFRENTEDIYAGLEVEAMTPDALKLRELLEDAFGWQIREDAGIGIKPISKTGSQRLQRAALQYAVDRGRPRVHWVHKGNIMKFTEGAFQKWGYELVREEFSDVAVGWDDCGGDPGDRILVQDAIADIALQQVLTRPAEFDVIATMNLNGDYLSDALAAQVGGIGIAPMPEMASFSISKGHQVTVIMGANTKTQLLPNSYWPQEVEYLTVTEDGSQGLPGLITEHLDEPVNWASKIYACGPEPMFSALARTLRGNNRRQNPEILMEAPMPCGWGICYSCAIFTKHGVQLCCKDGPRFKLFEVCLLYTSPSPRDATLSRMPSSA